MMVMASALVEAKDNWEEAKNAMNASLNGTGWQYELKDGNSLPTLKKQ